MNVLALEPFYGGSHRAFLDGWAARSRHRWTVLGLPPHHWKWRMRHAAVTLARRAAEGLAIRCTTRMLADGRSESRVLRPSTAGRGAGRYLCNGLLGAAPTPDLLFCSDMLNLAEFLGLAPRALRAVPVVAYFHENQLTYPVRHAAERDLHFAFTNLTTAVAANAVWFNSAYHRDEFLTALRGWLERMPDFQPLGVIDDIRAKSQVQTPAIDSFPPRGRRRPGPLRILWAARWEYDKNPDQFFEALAHLKAAGVPFRVSVIGEQFAESPACFSVARDRFRAEIDRWGYQPDRREYVSALQEADVIVSTANHEFFGVGVVEAVAAGCWPLVPRRLAYPEILGMVEDGSTASCFYDGTTEDLCSRLCRLAEGLARGAPRPDTEMSLVSRVARFDWAVRAPELDRALELVRRHG